MALKRMGRSWHLIYPDRWRQELKALQSAGLPYRITYPRGGVRLLVTWPLGDDRAATLRVDFGLYPWFPPRLSDPKNAVGAIRHRNPLTGTLCLIPDDGGWTSQTTVAELLTTQLPKVLTTNAPGPVDPAVEVNAPEGPNTWRPASGPAVIAPVADIPTAEVCGALVASMPLGNTATSLVVETVRGAGWSVTQDRLPTSAAKGRVAVYGRWLRMPDFDPCWPTQDLWRRVESRIRPFQVEPLGARYRVRPDRAQLIGLLVPGEPAYRRPGEEWVFLLVLKSDARARWTAVRCQTQTLPGAESARTPGTAVLGTRHAVVVGVGAIGHHVALGLGRAGVGRLDIVDRDVVDIGTASRQFTPLAHCGRPKAHVLAEAIQDTAPMSTATGFALDIADLDLDHPDYARVRHALVRADLVVDAAANPLVTRYLGALRHAAAAPFLHVSGTAGAWAGLVTLTNATSGCWACVEHHRRDGTLPVPLADPAGWVTPTGCSSPTFTGDNASLASIAAHALRIAAATLTGAPALGRPGVWVAAMRGECGDPVPISWVRADVPAHPACPLHDPSLRGIT